MIAKLYRKKVGNVYQYSGVIYRHGVVIQNDFFGEILAEYHDYLVENNELEKILIDAIQRQMAIAIKIIEDGHEK